MRTSSRLAKTLLLVAISATLLALAAAAVAWFFYGQARQPVDLEQLTAVDRQRLYDELNEALPGIYEPTWFQPDIGYTLRPSTAISVWDDQFRSNRLGFRTGAITKQQDHFRILFVGDSWTYGMGVRREESYPEVLARLANEHAGIEQTVEAWTLALPGWNGINQTAAFDFWFGQLRPNAVVFAPSSNDNHSTAHLLPSGDLFLGTAAREDAFGAHPLTYSIPWPIDSYEYMQRWRQVGELWRAAEEKLAYYEIPAAFFFVALWTPELVHELAHTAGLESPYAVVPGSLTLGDWVNPTPAGHGTPAANERYAHLLYRLLAQQLGWSPLPTETVHEEIADLPIFERVPEPEAWTEDALAQRRRHARRDIPESYRLGEGVLAQWPGSGTHTNGEVGRATTVLVRPPAGTPALAVRLAALRTVRGLYPITATLRIPAPGGEIRRQVSVDDSRAREVALILPVPESLRDGRVLDVKVEASNIAGIGKSRVAGSLQILSIEPVEQN